MTNTKAILVIASAHGTKMLMALIDKTTLGLNSTDTTTSTNSTTTTKTYAYASPTQVAADKAFEGEFVDPDGNPSTNPDTGGTDEGK